MARFIGEFECKIDSKGRIILPAKLRSQIPDKEAKTMVINRGFEKCLVLYTSLDWNMETEKLQVLNDFNRTARKFIRQFNNGANIVSIDANSRINIPNNLIEYASLSGDIIVSCYNHKIEIWDKKHYDEELKFDDEEFSRMAEDLMGNKNNGKKRTRMVKTTEAYHVPVMLNECIDGLNIKKDGTYVDVTFGGGGHSKEILKHLGENGKLYAFDQDSDAAKNLPDDERLVFINHNFRYIKQFLTYLKALPVDGILADLGISSFQINEADKGFAHRLDGELDMRMDQNAKLKANDIINSYSEKSLLKVFNQYGEIRNAFKLVQVIIERRKIQPITTIEDFKEAIKSCIPSKEESKYLSQVFQALRIEVNSELKALEILLENVPELLSPGGRLVVMSYHSLEDRLVKNFIQTGNISGEVDKDFYGNRKHVFKAINKKPVTPSEEEIKVNKRARSAKLRIAEKI